MTKRVIKKKKKGVLLGHRTIQYLAQYLAYLKVSILFAFDYKMVCTFSHFSTPFACFGLKGL